jgi:hypothetical protein
MATLITEPNKYNPNNDEWRVLIAKMTSTTGGLNLLGITNMANGSAPVVQDGSRIEVNGSFYKAGPSETISGSPTANTVNYVYIVPNNATATFQYNTTAPTWQPAKGGWFHPTNNWRAILKFFYVSGAYNGKVILDSYGAMQAVNVEQPVPTTGGVAVVNTSTPGEGSVSLAAGAYRYEVQGGKGGDGGSGGNNNSTGSGGGAGGAGGAGTISTGNFNLPGACIIRFKVGANGASGSNGTNRSNTSLQSAGGGGGGATGGNSSIMEVMAFGGNGGGGGGGSSAGGPSGNGGSGGGNMVGGNGTDGGNGADVTGSIPGGSGGVSSIYPSNTGAKGNSGTSGTTPGGAGGSGYSSTSSGYVRIYRLW